jgi:diguanylate cyclase (GGDEF)-like protein/PAS domain S-box-containing protein
MEKYMPAPLPENESERLGKLDQLQLLDTLPEASYDAIVKLASQLCETPIAFFGLLDETRQWYKAKIGVVDDSVPRELTYCQYAMLEPDAVMVVPDARKDARLACLPFANAEPSFVFYAGLPVQNSSGQVMGMLCVIDHKPRQLSDEQRSSLQALGVILQDMLDQRRQTKENENELFRLKLAADSATLVLWDFNIRTRKGHVGDQLELLLGLDKGQFDGSVDTFLQYVYPDDRTMLTEHHRREIELHDFQRFEFRVNHRDGSIRWLVSRSRGIFDRQGKLTNIAGLLFDRTEQHMVDEQLQHYQQELLQLTQQLEKLSLSDALTGIKNRRAFDELLKSQVAYGQRHDSELSLLMIDVDNFKTFNDQYGHPAGDEVLRIIASIIQAAIRAEDSAARYGGEEFSAILPDANTMAAEQTAERIRRTIESYAWAQRSITVSIGVATQRGFSIDEKLLMSMADACLYRAKASGRNIVCS